MRFGCAGLGSRLEHGVEISTVPTGFADPDIGTGRTIDRHDHGVGIARPFVDRIDGDQVGLARDTVPAAEP